MFRRRECKGLCGRLIGRMWKEQAILERAVPHRSENKHPDCLWGLLSLPVRARPRQSVKQTTLFGLLPRIACCSRTSWYIQQLLASVAGGSGRSVINFFCKGPIKNEREGKCSQSTQLV